MATSEILKLSENLDPNLVVSTPCRRRMRSPATTLAKSKKAAPKTPVRTLSSSPAPVKENAKTPEGSKRIVVEDEEAKDLDGSSKARMMRRLMLEEAMRGLPEPGAGRVMYLVKTFERLLSISKETVGERSLEMKRKVMNWALPGLQHPPRAKVTELSSSPVTRSTEFLPTEDDKDERLSCGSDETDVGPKNQQNFQSTGSSGRSRSKKLKVKTQQPFKLRTEQRGRFKEEQFIKMVKEMLLEKKRCTPIAQRLPWTTDEPEILIKPHVKEPIDLVLHSDVHAAERAEFDLHVAESMSFVQQMKMERERQKKVEEEEEEKRRLGKELVLKAQQPMPCFDQPSVPRKSTKPQTVPKEPRFPYAPQPIGTVRKTSDS
ncbi:microtubule-destabilizing protein 60-like [Musa acuminata AAA Group]|uniref:microtubule-destabilizing protein 60-like n=1 Tax=Musa acuminata AAA Group TaxID=214697 RepID=UPI0031D253EB